MEDGRRVSVRARPGRADRRRRSPPRRRGRAGLAQSDVAAPAASACASGWSGSTSRRWPESSTSLPTASRTAAASTAARRRPRPASPWPRPARRSSTSAANRPGPGAKPVWEGDEIERVLPAVTRLAAGGTAVSIDTRKAAVMEAALGAGAAMVNDVSALTWDERSAGAGRRGRLPGRADAPSRARPETMQQAPSYDGPVLFAVYDWLEARIAAAEAAGIDARADRRRSRTSASARRSSTISTC